MLGNCVPNRESEGESAGTWRVYVGKTSLFHLLRSLVSLRRLLSALAVALWRTSGAYMAQLALDSLLCLGMPRFCPCFDFYFDFFCFLAFYVFTYYFIYLYMYIH